MYLEERLDEIKVLLTGCFSPYLTLNEASTYLKLCPSTIKKQMGKTMYLGKHYFKPTGDKIIFAKIELDNWVKEEKQREEADDGVNNNKGQNPMDKVISEWRNDKKVNGLI